jgi:hypothetical protein
MVAESIVCVCSRRVRGGIDRRERMCCRREQKFRQSPRVRAKAIRQKRSTIGELPDRGVSAPWLLSQSCASARDAYVVGSIVVNGCVLVENKNFVNPTEYGLKRY